MRYCYNCHRITPGEPLFCNRCGRSYDRKLCPHRHVNTRNALVCSECGSRDLSMPQPRGLWRSKALILLFRLVPGIVLILTSLVALVAATEIALNDPEPIGGLVLIVLPLGLLWALFIGWSGMFHRTSGRGRLRPTRKRRKGR